MPKINVETREGERLVLEGEVGRTLMSVLKDAGLVEALCGGQCACATCHVHLAPEFLERVGRAEGTEFDLLDSSIEADDTSRLSCQIALKDDLDGLTIKVAQAEN